MNEKLSPKLMDFLFAKKTFSAENGLKFCIII